MTEPAWIGVDWGTSNLRAFAMDRDWQVMEERQSDRGMGSLTPDEFEGALLALVENWLPAGQTTRIYACGMVGARQGWTEAAYRPVPCSPTGNGCQTSVDTTDKRISVHIVPGLSQLEPADVMRGEETQLAGLLEIDPDFSGSVCLPGTHSKWASMRGGIVEQFRTFMTGELFSLVAKKSVLRHSIAGHDLDQKTFLAAATKAARDPSSVTAELFGIRASSLLARNEPEQAFSKLSGMLVGQEIGLTQPYWKTGQTALIGASRLSKLYADTLIELGANVREFDARSVTLAGLKAVVRQHGKVEMCQTVS